MCANFVLSEALKQDNTSRGINSRVALSRLRLEIDRRFTDSSPSLSLEFFRNVVDGVSQIRGQANLALRIECLWSASHFLYLNGKSIDALTASRSLDRFLPHCSPTWQRKIHLLAGVIHADLGDISTAVTRHTNALRIAREHHDCPGEAMALTNLGVALNYAGLYSDAIACLRRASLLSLGNEVRTAERDEGRPEHTFRCLALTNLAQSYLYIDQPDLALTTIEECLDLSPLPQDAVASWGRVIREFTCVRAALSVGQIDKAVAHTAVCRANAAEGNGRGEILALICEGLCDVTIGDVERGLTRLEDALHRSESIGSARLTALMALAQAADSIDRPSIALDYMDRVMAQIAAHRGKNIVALVSSLGIDPTRKMDDLAGLKIARANLRARMAERATHDAHLEMLERLALASDLKVETSGGHGYRVGRLSKLLATKLGWPREDCHAIELAGRLHDIGKIGMPDRILLKSQELIAAERRFVTSHVTLGAEILSSGRFEGLLMAREVALHHHERWDGSGYPRGLKGNRIPIAARLVAIADVFDALTHRRTYGPTMAIGEAVQEIAAKAAGDFDPDLATEFLSLIMEIQECYPDIDSHLGESESNSSFAHARGRINAFLAELPLGV